MNEEKGHTNKGGHWLSQPPLFYAKDHAVVCHAEEHRGCTDFSRDEVMPELVRYEGRLSQPCLPPPSNYHDHTLCCTLREQKDMKTACQCCGPKDQEQKFWMCPVLPGRRTKPLQAQIILDINRNLRTLTGLALALHPYSDVILHGFIK